MKAIFSGKNTYSSLKSIYRQEVHKFHNLHCRIHRVGYKDLAWERESVWLHNTFKYTIQGLRLSQPSFKYTIQRLRLSQPSFSTTLQVLPTKVSLDCLQNGCGIVQWLSVETNLLSQRPALDLSPSCLTGRLQRVNPSAAPPALWPELLSPMLGHTWAWALTHSWRYLHWLQPAQLSPDPLIWQSWRGPYARHTASPWSSINTLCRQDAWLATAMPLPLWEGFSWLCIRVKQLADLIQLCIYHRWPYFTQ